MKTIFAIIAMLAIIAVLAFYDAVEEGYDIGISLIFAVFPAFLLFIINWIALEVKIRKKGFSFTSVGAMFINGLTLIVYCFYAVDGQSNPDTAAHMHVIAFPILLAIASVILLLPLLVTDFVTRNK